tara:strand:- start:384 stop:1574 length:1191 start_codon:yes stop_codon:yes gene_type:complete
VSKTRLHITIFDGSLKTTTFINRLIEGLSEHHQVSVFGFTENLKEPIPGVRYVALGSAAAKFRLAQLGVVFASKALFRLGSLSLFLKSLGLLLRFRKKALQQHHFDIAIALHRPDIVHVQWPSLLPWCEGVLEHPTIKVVLSQRGYQNNVRPFVTEENRNYLKKMYPKIDGFHSVSKAMVQVGNTIFNSADKVNAVVYSGFDLEGLPFNYNYSRNPKLKIISIGRPHWKKGYSYALRAMQFFKNANIPFQYTIIGAKGDEELEYLLNVYEIKEAVQLLPKVSQQEVYDLLRKSDVFLLPSLEEGLPNVMIEAMALGIPVIATDCGGVSELLDETTGSIVPTRNPKAMAEAISTFYTAPIADIDIQRALARKRVEMKHTATQMVKDMEALYFEVLDH